MSTTSTFLTAQSSLWTTSLVLVVVLLCKYVSYKLGQIRMMAKIPGLKYPLPFSGHLHLLAGAWDDLLYRGMAITRRHGPKAFKAWCGETPMVMLVQPEDVEPVLSSQKVLEKPDYIYRPVRGFFGDGLITLNGQQWFQHRRAITPAFHFNILEKYAGIFTRRAAVFSERIAALAGQGQGGDTFDAIPHYSRFVTMTIMETAFGIPPSSLPEDQDPVLNEFLNASEDAFDVIASRIMLPWLQVDSIFALTKDYQKYKLAVDIIDNFARRVIAKKRATIEAQRDLAEDVIEDALDDDGVRKKYTFLDMALRTKAGTLSDEELLGEVRTFIAVQQTTASTLSFCTVMLALNPEAQERARQEVLELDAAGPMHPLERLKRLKYVERFIKETLRLYPITFLIGRILGEDVVLPESTIPAGVMAVTFIMLTHRDPRHWPDPERFDPDRFLAERCAGRHPYAYVPFSAGPRNCIGQRYAMLQMKAVLAALLTKYTVLPGRGLETRDKLKLGMNIFLTIQGGFNVRLQRREGVETVEKQM